jgi:hypothetical protein
MRKARYTVGRMIVLTPRPVDESFSPCIHFGKVTACGLLFHVQVLECRWISTLSHCSDTRKARFRPMWMAWLVLCLVWTTGVWVFPWLTRWVQVRVYFRMARPGPTPSALRVGILLWIIIILEYSIQIPLVKAHQHIPVWVEIKN